MNILNERFFNTLLQHAVSEQTSSLASGYLSNHARLMTLKYPASEGADLNPCNKCLQSLTSYWKI